MKRKLFGVPAVLLLISAVPALAQEGAAIYRANCAGCHNSMSNAHYKERERTDIGRHRGQRHHEAAWREPGAQG